MKKKLFIISIIFNLMFLVSTGIFLESKGGISFIINKINPIEKNTEKTFPYYEDRNTLFQTIGTRKEDVIFLGDSLIDNAEWGELLENSNVKNRGIAGDTVRGVINRIDYISSYNPKEIFISIGINDILRGKRPEDILAEIKQLVSKIDSTTIVYFHSILPVNSELYILAESEEIDIINQNVEILNQMIESELTSDRLIYVNIYKIMTLNKELSSEYTTDGLHLNGDAYQLWVAELRRIKDLELSRKK